MMLITTLLATIVYGLSFCTPGNQMCLNSQPVGQYMYFEVESRVQGFVAFGIGSSMSDADVMIMYKMGTNITVSSRYSNSHNLPKLYPKQVVEVFSNSSLTKTGAIYRFRRPLTASQQGMKDITNSQQAFIWSYSSSLTSESDLAQGHDAQGYGSGSGNLFQAQTATLKDADNVDTVHGSLMLTAWTAVVPISIFIARFGKKKLGVWWFRLHLGLLLIAAVMIYVAFCLIYSGTSKSLAHRVIGIVVIALLSTQVILGFVIDRLFNVTRSDVPWWDKLHWWVGRIVFLLAVANCIYGALTYDFRIHFILSLVFVALALTAFVAAQVLVGQSHHDNKRYRASQNVPEFETMNLNKTRPSISSQPEMVQRESFSVSQYMQSPEIVEM